MNVLSVPPLSFGERFEDVYEVNLILDDREHFASQGLVSSCNCFFFFLEGGGGGGWVGCALSNFSFCGTEQCLYLLWFTVNAPRKCYRRFALNSKSK